MPNERIQEDSVTDPEESVSERETDLTEVEVDEADEFDRPAPIEADEADAQEQKLDVPDRGEDDYR